MTMEIALFIFGVLVAFAGIITPETEYSSEGLKLCTIGLGSAMATLAVLFGNIGV